MPQISPIDFITFALKKWSRKKLFIHQSFEILKTAWLKQFHSSFRVIAGLCVCENLLTRPCWSNSQLFIIGQRALYDVEFSLLPPRRNIECVKRSLTLPIIYNNVCVCVCCSSNCIEVIARAWLGGWMDGKLSRRYCLRCHSSVHIIVRCLISRSAEVTHHHRIAFTLWFSNI